ncbi:hypothetical protein SNEBB_000078 [Seison nebaliae]|nr:hypothetical protein SNEBB_000078 [Seison nebaliae]
MQLRTMIVRNIIYSPIRNSTVPELVDMNEVIEILINNYIICVIITTLMYAVLNIISKNNTKSKDMERNNDNLFWYTNKIIATMFFILWFYFFSLFLVPKAIYNVNLVSYLALLYICIRYLVETNTSNDRNLLILFLPTAIATLLDLFFHNLYSHNFMWIWFIIYILYLFDSFKIHEWDIRFIFFLFGLFIYLNMTKQFEWTSSHFSLSKFNKTKSTSILFEVDMKRLSPGITFPFMTNYYLYEIQSIHSIELITLMTLIEYLSRKLKSSNVQRRFRNNTVILSIIIIPIFMMGKLIDIPYLLNVLMSSSIILISFILENYFTYHSNEKREVFNV